MTPTPYWREHRLFQEGKPTLMTGERIQDLESVGFDWGPSKTEFASIWSARFQQLCEYKAQFGNFLVPYQYAANPKPGKWFSNQRYQCELYQERKPSSMTAERIRDLENDGFKWEQTYLTWNEQFEQLCEFKTKLGHCLVPQQYSANPKLGWWVSKQRKNYKLYHEGEPSPMTEERIRELENIDFKGKRNSVP